MSDVYEIGVSLALDEGVSAGIQKARRDMAELAGVLQFGGVSVQTLRETAERALRTPFWGRPETPPAVRIEPTTEPAWTPADRSDAAPKRPSANETATATIPMPVVQAAPLAWPPALPPSAPAPREATPVERLRGIDPEGSPESPVAPAMAELVIVAQPAPIAPQAAQTVAAIEKFAAPDPGTSAVTPPAPLWRQSAPVDLLPEPAAWVPELPARPASLPLLTRIQQQPGVSPPSPMPEVAGYAVAAAAPGRPAPLPAPLPVSVLQGAGAPPAPGPAYAAPGAPASPQEDSPGAEAMGQMPMAPPTAPPSRPAAPMSVSRPAPGPNEGDVFLDGQLVGRWMSRFLNREAGRASSGPTGFDARRGQLMPGPTVGG
jgi:hypothetical protein